MKFLCFAVFLLAATSARAVTEDQLKAVAYLRQYCQACHAVGTKRFITSEDDLEVWEYIQTMQAPGSRMLWRDGISKVLNWPSDISPPFDSPMEPTRDWMPKGGKRLDFSTATIDGQSVRTFILRQL